MRIAAVLASLLLAACQREPSFDERYAKTQQVLDLKAAEIDRQVVTPSSAPSPTRR